MWYFMYIDQTLDWRGFNPTTDYDTVMIFKIMFLPIQLNDKTMSIYNTDVLHEGV